MDQQQLQDDAASVAKARARECSNEIQGVLAKHRCQIVPMLTSEPVGHGPATRALIGATYGILPTE